jgi:hypothetical protein
MLTSSIYLYGVSIGIYGKFELSRSFDFVDGGENSKC